MAAPSAEYSIILRGRFPGKDRAVAQAMARAFARDEAWGLQVVGVAPITVLSGLTAVQAQVALSALVEVEHAGCRFQSQQGLDKSCPSIQWPTPPRLLGKSIDELTGSGAHSGAAPTGGEVHAPCPHCGKPIQIRLTAQSVQVQMWSTPGGALAPAAKQTIPVPGSKGVAGLPMPMAPASMGSHLAAPIPIPIPVPMHAAPRVPGIHAQGPRPSQSGPTQPSAALEPFQNSDLEELTPILDFPQAPAAPGPSKSRPPGGLRPSAGIPLPEVPIVGAPSHPVSTPPTRGVLPVSAMDPRMSGPMAMEDFEAGLARKAPPHPPAEPAAPASGNGDSNAALQRMVAENPDATCSIFIGKSNNPKVHELVAEIQGITSREAQKLCQKPVVPIVKDIPVSEAHSIKQRFLEININPRVTLRR